MSGIYGTIGNDTRLGDPTDDYISGGPNGAESTDTGADSLFGGGGNDTLVGWGGADTIRGSAGDDSIIGGGGDDELIGDDGRDTVLGGAGNDYVAVNGAGANDVGDGGPGDDYVHGRSTNDPAGLFVSLIGGPGADTLFGYNYNFNIADYSDETSGIHADLTAGTVVATGGTDSLVNFRAIEGSAHADTIRGSVNNDRILPGDGADSLDGAAGFDVVRYLGATSGVFVDLAAGRATDAGGSADTLLGFEGAVGGEGADTLLGDANTNDITGMQGNDVLDGRGGYDWVLYGTTFGPPQTQGALVNLHTGTATDPWGGTDTIANFEAIVGSNLGDRLTGRHIGDGTISYVRGIAGADTISAPFHDSDVSADYSNSTSGVIVNLSPSNVFFPTTIFARTARDGHGTTDKLEMIQKILGSAFSDTVVGSERNDLLVGGDGNDNLLGGAGDDSLYGGRGADTFDGGDGYDRIVLHDSHGSSPASLAAGTIAFDGFDVDSIVGGAANTIEMLVGNGNANDLTGKIIPGTGGAFGNREISYLRGNGGADTLRGVADGERWIAADYLDDPDSNADGFGVTVDLAAATATDGRGATDTLILIGAARGSAFDDLLTGNAGANWFRGQAGDDTVIGGDGVDFLSHFTSTVSVVADLENGIVQDGLGGTDSISGIEQIGGSETASDTLLGNAANNLISGYGGADSLDGRGGNDTLEGDTGADTLTGGLGNDSLAGGEGNDWLDGGAGADSMNGGTGNDAYVISSVADLITDSGGYDTVRARINVTLGDGMDALVLLGSVKNGTGNALDNRISGNVAANRLNGAGGNDFVIAGDGADTLDGGTGADKLLGGAGNDLFLFGTPDGNTDRILDFASGDDMIGLLASAFPALAGGIGAANFQTYPGGTPVYAAGVPVILYNTDTGALWYDPDGMGGVLNVRIGVVAGVPTLDAGDFTVIA